jgi:stage V sporulation protein G
MVPSGERVKMHCDVAHPINAECRQMIEKEILAAFDAETRKAQQPGYVAKTIGDGGEAVVPSELTNAH